MLLISWTFTQSTISRTSSKNTVQSTTLHSIYTFTASHSIDFVEFQFNDGSFIQSSDRTRLYENTVSQSESFTFMTFVEFEATTTAISTIPLTSTLQKVEELLPVNPPAEKPKLLDVLEANSTCSVKETRLVECLTQKSGYFISTRVEWYLLLILNTFICVGGTGLFFKLKFREMVMKKTKVRTNGFWTKLSYVSILPIVLLSYLLLIIPRFPGGCSTLPSVMGFAIICIVSTHLQSLLRIVLRLVLVRGNRQSKPANSGVPSVGEEDPYHSSRLSVLIDIICKVTVVFTICIELIISGSSISSNPMKIANYSTNGNIAYLLTCRPSDINSFIGSFFIPKIILLVVVLLLSLYFINSPEVFATTKLDDIPEALEDVKLSLKTAYISFI